MTQTSARTAQPVPTTGASSFLDGAVTRRDRLVVLLVVAAAATLFILAQTLAWTHGHLAYAIDDPAIHLAVARNLVRHGTWGVGPGVYESASSSPLWTLLLAPFVWVFGYGANVVPLLLNLAAGAWICYRFASIPVVTGRRDWGGWLILLVLPVVILFIPTLAFIGMEHTLHAALTLEVFLTLEGFARAGYSSARLGRLAVLLFLGTATRPEGAFVAAGCTVAFVFAFAPRVARAAALRPLSRRIRGAVVSAVAGLLPIGIIAAVNHAFGQGFLPNSEIAKTTLAATPGYVPSVSEVVSRAHADLFVTLCLAVSIVYVAFAIAGRTQVHSAFATALAVTIVLHFLFADMGWFGRYQMYMVIAGAYLVLTLAVEYIRPDLRWRNVAFAAIALVAVVCSEPRAALTRRTALASSNNYRQNYQAGRFLERYYRGQAVAVNDLGYMSWFHDGPMIDFVGLGSYEVIKKRQVGGLDTAFLRKLVAEHHVQVIVVFREWYQNIIPREWVPVAGWELGQQNVFPEPHMTFYAPNAAQAAVLRRNLEAFQPELPAGTHPIFLH
jgi:hypothetical protein